MKKLPIGIQTFDKIIKGNYLYVDKTKDILELLESRGTYFFISRPRRFGKSLLVSTLKEIFEGNKELFRGLYIYDKIEWKKYPVIKIDFTGISYSDDIVLRESLTSFIFNTAKRHGIDLVNKFVGDSFQELLQRISEKYKTQVVLLIDEYDKPIIDKLPDIEKSAANREVLRELYGAIKGADPYLKFVFITGVSKFAQVSIFSGLNNLTDLTLSPMFSTLVGITEEEIKKYFDEYITVFAQVQKIAREDAVQKIRYWYNGYSWDGIRKIYNPFSILNLFFDNRFRNYWFATGTPTFLIKLFQEKKYAIPEIENCTASDSTFDSYDIDTMDITALLFQTGYITVKNIRQLKEGGYLYTLSYPNFEVKESLLQNIMSSFTQVNTPKVKPLIENMKDALALNDIDGFISFVQSILAGTPYTIIKEDESYYHTVFYLIASLMGFSLDPEVLTNQGRIDGVLEFSDTIYIIEFKYRKSTLDAIAQIKNKKYHEKYVALNKKIYLLGINFIDKKIDYRLEELIG